VPDPGVPGFLALQGGAGERYMRIGGERHATGSGEVLRLTQRIASDAAMPFHFRVRARADKDVRLYLRPCRKHLLYAEDCVTAAVDLKGGSGWQDLELKQWTGGEGFARPGWLPRPASLSIHVDGRGQVDVDDVQAFDGQRAPVAQRGFRARVDYWFFSSDRDHLPWHAKNTRIQLRGTRPVRFGDAGAGLAGRRSASAAGAHPAASAGARAACLLAGITTVGLVDSLLDMPRITLMIMLVLWLSLSLRQPSQ
jgi:hypothetical protein